MLSFVRGATSGMRAGYGFTVRAMPTVRPSCIGLRNLRLIDFDWLPWRHRVTAYHQRHGESTIAMGGPLSGVRGVEARTAAQMEYSIWTYIFRHTSSMEDGQMSGISCARR